MTAGSHLPVGGPVASMSQANPHCGREGNPGSYGTGLLEYYSAVPGASDATGWPRCERG